MCLEDKRFFYKFAGTISNYNIYPRDLTLLMNVVGYIHCKKIQRGKDSTSYEILCKLGNVNEESSAEMKLWLENLSILIDDFCKTVTENLKVNSKYTLEDKFDLTPVMVNKEFNLDLVKRKVGGIIYEFLPF